MEKWTVDALRQTVERRRKVNFWGSDYFIQPRVVSRVFGDGARVIYYTPLNTRPSYYVVLVDSTWAVSYSDADAADYVGEHIEEISEAIEEDFGPAEWKDDRGRIHHDPFPALNDETGVSWGDYRVASQKPSSR